MLGMMAAQEGKEMAWEKYGATEFVPKAPLGKNAQWRLADKEEEPHLQTNEDLVDYGDAPDGWRRNRHLSSDIDKVLRSRPMAGEDCGLRASPPLLFYLTTRREFFSGASSSAATLDPFLSAESARWAYLAVICGVL
jgi:hypothetical protein